MHECIDPVGGRQSSAQGQECDVVFSGLQIRISEIGRNNKLLEGESET